MGPYQSSVNKFIETNQRMAEEKVEELQQKLSMLERELKGVLIASEPFINRETPVSKSEKEWLRILNNKKTNIENEIINTKDHLSYLKQVFDVSQSVDRIAESAEENLDKINAKPDVDEDVKKLQQQFKDLAEGTKGLVQLQAQQSLSNFAPRMSVLRPYVKLVDANLAYKYADLQSDTNILLGFTTFFLGISASTLISVITSFFVPTDKLMVAVYSSVFAMSVIAAVLFGLLARRAYDKSQTTKAQLEDEAGNQDIDLGLITHNENELKKEL